MRYSFGNLIRALRVGPGFALFLAVYVTILFWFKGIDIYDKEFSAAGTQVAIYNLCRTLYIFFLFWVIYQVGNFLLTCVARSGWRSVAGVDRMEIGFFAG